MIWRSEIRLAMRRAAIGGAGIFATLWALGWLP